MRILRIIETRPEAIKLAPVQEQLKNRQDEFDAMVVATGQHLVNFVVPLLFKF